MVRQDARAEVGAVGRGSHRLQLRAVRGRVALPAFQGRSSGAPASGVSSLVPTEDKWGVGDVMIGVLFRYVTEGDFKAL